MALVFETVDPFINEDMGNLRKYNLTPSMIKRITSYDGYDSEIGGRDSEIEVVEDPTNYKKLIDRLKEKFNTGIISVDGKAKYLFKRSGDRTFSMFNVEGARKEDLSQAAQRKEWKKRDEERKLEREERERQKAAEEAGREVNEARGRKYERSDPGEMGNYSVKSIIELIKKEEGEGHEVVLEIIKKDTERQSTYDERQKYRREHEDPLEQSGNDYSTEPSRSQKNRYAKYTTKRRLEIDQKVNAEREKIRKQVTDNFDKAFDDVLDNIRKGYDWYAKPEKIGEKIMDGVDMKGFKRLAAAYDAIEPDRDDAAKASRELKKLGYLD